MRRITGTHVYSYAKCPRLAALDLSLPKSDRRPFHPWEEFAAARGRDFEDVYVAKLGAVQPEYPARDFERGAQATLELLRQGVPWIHQAVLLAEGRLGLPDLLRRVDGASALGDHHYEVLDVKTSGHARGDQVLQVMFYVELLQALQGRMPSRAAIVLKDGSEHSFATRDYLAVLRDVDRALVQLAREPDTARPFLQRGCESCHWNHRCLPELEAKGDLSLVAGMSHGARAILEANGCRTVRDLAAFSNDGRSPTQLDSSLLRRLRKAAQARLAAAPVVEARPRQRSALSLDRAAIVHLLTDPYADRVLAFAVQHPIGDDDAIAVELPDSAAKEWSALKALLARIPTGVPLLHFDSTLPRWYEAHAFSREADTGLAARFVDLQRRLVAAALFQAPTFGLADLVRCGLGRDPLRAGHWGQAAMWAQEADGADKLVAKARADVQDLAELKRRILDAAQPPA
ncbi:MAG: TM0106 family RecB-like putative nuclease [Planctomycetota bacterium]